MKKNLMFFLLVVSLDSYAQKFNVQSAADSYRNLKNSKNVYKDLSDAKKYIDLAAANEQTSNDPFMWNYRGKIYLEIDRDTSETVRNIDPDAIEKSGTSFVNCMKTDTKKNFIEDCNNLIWVAGLRLYNKGVNSMNQGVYERAAGCFNLVLDILPFDKENNLKRNTITPELVNYNLAKTSFKAKENEKAKTYLQKLMDTNYNDPMIYIYMSSIYLEEKDTAKALTFIDKGRKNFEDNANLLNEEIRIYSLQQKYDVLINKFTDAININPDVELSYFYRASLYESKKDFDKAEADYKKAIELKPDYFDANYYLGALYFGQAAEIANAANKLKSNEEFEKAKVKYELKFKDAKPYLELALELNPKKTDEDKRIYRVNLNLLKQLYARTGEMDNYNKIKALQEQK